MSLLHHLLLSFLVFSVILKKLDSDVVIMLTIKLSWSSVMLLDTFIRKRANKLGKFVIQNFTPLIPVSILGSEMWCYTSVFITQILYINFNGLMSRFKVLLISLVLTVRLSIPRARVKSMLLLPEF